MDPPPPRPEVAVVDAQHAVAPERGVVGVPALIRSEVDRTHVSDAKGTAMSRRSITRRSSADDGTPAPPPKMKEKEYQHELRRLHGELVAMQEWVKASGAKVCIVFEGRDTAGKGGTIKAITERVTPRVFRVVALPAPTEREKSQMYVQRYIEHFPAAGEVVIFDRSWYNRAGVERVMGFCTASRCSGSSRWRRPSSRR